MTFTVLYFLATVRAFNNEPILNAILTIIFPINHINTKTTKIFFSATHTFVGISRLYRRSTARTTLS
jgi:hypothetical protein